MNHLTRSVSEQTGLYAVVTIWGNPGNTRETSHPRSLCLLSQSRVRLGVWPHSGERFVISESVLSCQLSNSGSGHLLTKTPSWTHHHSILYSPRLHPGLTIRPYPGLNKTPSWTHHHSMLDSTHHDFTCLIHQCMKSPHKVAHWRLLKLRLHGCTISLGPSGGPLV